MSEIRFDERVAIVTGAGGGLGREYALLLAQRGAKVLVNDFGGSPDGSGGSETPARSVVSEIEKAGGVAAASAETVVQVSTRGALSSNRPLANLVGTRSE